MSDDVVYCPICQRFIEASNKEELDSGEHEGYLFVHDDIVHTDEDIKALERGIQ